MCYLKTTSVIAASLLALNVVAIFVILFKFCHPKVYVNFDHCNHNHMNVLQEWEYFLGMIVSDALLEKEGRRQSRENLPGWIEAER